MCFGLGVSMPRSDASCSQKRPRSPSLSDTCEGLPLRFSSITESNQHSTTASNHHSTPHVFGVFGLVTALSMVCWLSPSAALAQDNPNTEGAPVRSMPATSPVVAPETIPSNPEKAAKPAPPIKKLNGKKAAKVPSKAKTKKVVSPAPALQTPKELGGIVGAILVKGNKKIENDAVLARLVSHVSDPFSSDKVRKDVEALFKTGYFYDIQVDRSVGSDGKINLVYNSIYNLNHSQVWITIVFNQKKGVRNEKSVSFVGIFPLNSSSSKYFQKQPIL